MWSKIQSVADALDDELCRVVVLHDVHAQRLGGGTAGDVPELEVGDVIEEFHELGAGELIVIVVIEGVDRDEVVVERGGFLFGFPGPDGLYDLVDDQREGRLDEQFDELGFFREVVLKQALLHAGFLSDDGQGGLGIAGLGEQLERDAGDALLFREVFLGLFHNMLLYSECRKTVLIQITAVV